MLICLCSICIYYSIKSTLQHLNNGPLKSKLVHWLILMPWDLALGSHQGSLMLGSKKITMDEKFT
jgi:hypothetical protein